MKKRPYWLCRCGIKNDRLKRKCPCGRARPKPRVVAHAKTLRDDPYTVYTEIAEKIHGVSDESCCACGRPRSLERRHDRDHDHKTGAPRGLLCMRHNKMLDSRCSPEELRALADYLERVRVFYSSNPGRVPVGS